MMQSMMQSMPHGMMGGYGGWLMMGSHLLLVVVLVLAVAALVKYLFFIPRSKSGSG